jgi:hypothetical protein
MAQMPLVQVTGTSLQQSAAVVHAPFCGTQQV